MIVPPKTKKPRLIIGHFYRLTDQARPPASAIMICKLKKLTDKFMIFEPLDAPPHISGVCHPLNYDIYWQEMSPEEILMNESLRQEIQRTIKNMACGSVKKLRPRELKRELTKIGLKYRATFDINWTAGNGLFINVRMSFKDGTADEEIVVYPDFETS